MATIVSQFIFKTLLLVKSELFYFQRGILFLIYVYLQLAIKENKKGKLAFQNKFPPSMINKITASKSKCHLDYVVNV